MNSCLARATRIELVYHGVKFHCLTAWLRPYIIVRIYVSPAWVRTIPRLPYPTRIYYLSLVDPTSCFPQRYFLNIVRKFVVVPLYRQERKFVAFISLINSTLLTFAQRHLLYTRYIDNLYQPPVLWSISIQIPQERCFQFQMLSDVLHTLLLSVPDLHHEHYQMQ